MRLFATLFLLVFMLMPHAAEAVSWIPIVPCGSTGQEPCSPCHLFEGVKNVTDLILFGVTGPIAAFMVVLAGGMMLIGGANPAQYSRGKALLTNTLIGVTIILLSWAATNFLIKSISTGSTNDAWYEFTCPAFLADIENKEFELPKEYGIGPVPPIIEAAPFPLPEGWSDTSLSLIAQYYGTKFPRQNSPALIRLTDCIYSDPTIAAMAYPKPVMGGGGKQTNQVFTYDNDYDACNYTHGHPLLGGGCSHSRYSCHYGGKTGSNGAEAIDINALLKEVVLPGKFDKDGKPIKAYASEQRLFCELHRVLVTEKKCPDFKYIDLHNEHNHISTKSCDKDGDGAGTTFNAAACKQLLAVPATTTGGSSTP
jgi:hypothetical protein